VPCLRRTAIGLQSQSLALDLLLRFKPTILDDITTKMDDTWLAHAAIGQGILPMKVVNIHQSAVRAIKA
jgi:hypothetical protein